jgi:hypothetical protein
MFILGPTLADTRGYLDNKKTKIISVSQAINQYFVSIYLVVLLLAKSMFLKKI